MVKYQSELCVEKVNEYFCKECDKNITGHDKIQQHLSKHIQQVCSLRREYWWDGGSENDDDVRDDGAGYYIYLYCTPIQS